MPTICGIGGWKMVSCTGKWNLDLKRGCKRMANNRIYLRCMGYGDVLCLGKTYDMGYWTDSTGVTEHLTSYMSKGGEVNANK